MAQIHHSPRAVRVVEGAGSAASAGLRCRPSVLPIGCQPIFGALDLEKCQEEIAGQFLATRARSVITWASSALRGGRVEALHPEWACEITNASARLDLASTPRVTALRSGEGVRSRRKSAGTPPGTPPSCARRIVERPEDRAFSGPGSVYPLTE